MTLRLIARLALVLTLAGIALPSALAGQEPPLLVTIDDLPVASRLHVQDADERRRLTRALLGALDDHGIRAVGFVTWKNVLDPTDRALLETWLDAGHELGNHTALHEDINAITADAYIEDAETGRALLEKLLRPRGMTPRFFRFTYLREGDTAAKVLALRAYLQESGQRPLPATIHTRDWAFEKPYLDARRAGDDEAMRRILEDYQRSLRASVRRHRAAAEELAPGETLPQVLLLHANAIGAEGWDEFFAWLRGEGFRFAKADEVLAHPLLADVPPRPSPLSLGLWERRLDERRRARAEVEVRALLARQAEAWSRGDLEGFMSAYADDVVFVSPMGLTEGSRSVLERYRKRYPDRSAMGRLSLEVLEIRPAAGREATHEGDALPSRVHAVSLVARWTLSYPDDPEKNEASGLTLLVLHPTREGWRIVQDASM